MKSFIEFLQERKYWGTQAAGGILISKTSKRVLFLLRSKDEDSEQEQWEMCVGGKQDDADLDAYATFIRESFEEIGMTQDMIDSSGMVEIFYDTGDDHKPFKYHVFFVYINEEFTPTLSDEHTDFKWVDINGNLPSPIHFGTDRLLMNPKILDLVK